MVEGCLTARLISRAETKVGHSDPVIPYGRVIAHQIKGTLGITGLSLPSVHSGGAVWHLKQIGVLQKQFCTKKSAYNGEPVSETMAGSPHDNQLLRPAIPWEV